LHGHRLDPALFEPIGHCSQFGGGASEATYGFAASVRWYRHIVDLITDINAGGIGMHHLQVEVLALDFSLHLPPLLFISLQGFWRVRGRLPFLVLCGGWFFMCYSFPC
jgi:hypothetical protein